MSLDLSVLVWFESNIPDWAILIKKSTYLASMISEESPIETPCDLSDQIKELEGAVCLFKETMEDTIIDYYIDNLLWRTGGQEGKDDVQPEYSETDEVKAIQGKTERELLRESVKELFKEYNASSVRGRTIIDCKCKLNKSSVIPSCSKPNCKTPVCIGSEFCVLHSKDKEALPIHIEICSNEIKNLMKFFFLFYDAECDMKKLSEYLGMGEYLPSIKKQKGLCGYLKKDQTVCLSALSTENGMCNQHGKIYQSKTTEDKLAKKAPKLREKFQVSSESDSEDN